MKIKMEKGSRPGVAVFSVEELRNMFYKTETYSDTKIIASKSFVIFFKPFYNFRKEHNKIYFDGYSDRCYTATAKKIMDQNGFSVDVDFVYYCDREQGKLVGEKIEFSLWEDEIKTKIKIKDPFSIPVEKLKEIRFNLFIKKFPKLKEKLDIISSEAIKRVGYNPIKATGENQ